MINILKKFAKELNNTESQAFINKSIEEFDNSLYNRGYLVIDVRELSSIFDPEKVEADTEVDQIVLDPR
jgi:hypothetical protein